MPNMIASKNCYVSMAPCINRLVEEMTTIMLAEFDAETRFKLRAARGAGKAKRGLRLLAKAQGKK
jgi:hypothetical protein